MILQKITEPKDIKKLSLPELKRLAEEIREFIIEQVTKTGGHLASNLGTVELTIALHYIFNSPEDVLIWDTGHQSYTHKILTGRLQRFSTLRQKDGLTPFITPEESIHDSFISGHAGNAISLADGTTIAKSLLKRKSKVITIVGDAAFGNGESFEAINHIGHHRKHCIVILNDNEMSISKNVGATARYFNKIITQPLYNQFKSATNRWLKKIPLIGKPLIFILDRIQEFLKGFILPGIIFEELGFRYIGPIDGHDLETLIKTFQRTFYMEDRPLLIHVITKKGKGYLEAEKNPEKLHSVSPFSSTKDQVSNYSEIFGKTLIQLAEKDPLIVAVVAAMKEGTGLKEFANIFPERFFDVGIAEAHAVTFAAALAKEGFKPFVAIYSTFLQRAFDQIIHDVCISKLPVRFCIDRAGIVGEDGTTHNGQFDISFLSLIPNITILAPKDEKEFQKMIRVMADYNKGPISVRYPKAKCSFFEPLELSFNENIFQAEIITQKGKDCIVISAGSMVFPSVKAAEILEKERIYITVVNSRCIKPLDEETILPLLKESSFAVTVEENSIIGGLGSAVSLLAVKHKISGIIFDYIGLPDSFINTGSRDILLEDYGLTAEMIAERILNLIKTKNSPVQI